MTVGVSFDGRTMRNWKSSPDSSLSIYRPLAVNRRIVFLPSC